MAHIDDIIDFFMSKAGVPKKKAEAYHNSSSDMPQDRSPQAPESAYLRGPNEDVNQIPLPDYLVGRPGPEQYAYALDHLHDLDQGNEDHSSDVTAVPWNKSYPAAVGQDKAAELAQLLADRFGGPHSPALAALRKR